MTSPVLRTAALDSSLDPVHAFKRSAGFGQVRQVRSLRAKTKCVADAGRVNGIAIRPTEDKGARRFAAARTVPGSTDRTQPASRVPDVPLEMFVLDLASGPKGLLINSESLCGTGKKAAVTMAGQNGAVLETKTKLQTACSSKARHKRHHARHSNARKAG